MPAVGPRAKNWCFTLDNYGPDDVDRLSAATAENSSTLPDVEYIVFGREVGATGTPLLQGTVCFLSRKRLAQVITVIGQARCSVTRNLRQSINYCKKDGDFTEIGEPPVDKDKKVGEPPVDRDKKVGRDATRNDLEDFKASVKNEGITDMKVLRDLHTEVCARYPTFVNEYINDYKDQT
jgi:Putative viral replication protein